MPKINILEPSVYNQISAGEVVENPASIVKELVENSIDAGAQNISIMIEEGGIKQISITDDGEGMTQDDLKKSIMPHATSKIKDASDLLTISTLGFRGEALASIAAVSHMEIKTKHALSDQARFIKVKGGEIIEEGVTALNFGTSITINSLFYNTPARYKFLKSKKSEQAQITNLVADMILANSSISISYYVDNKLIFHSIEEGLKSAVESIYDKNITENLLEVNFEDKPYKVSGFIAKPDTPAIKFNRNFQTIILNGRVIKDFSLSAVVQNAYGNTLMKSTFPLFVIDIVLPFDMVDVNVHPNKKEVRFSKNCKIYAVLYNAVKETLNKEYQLYNEDFSLLKENTKQKEDEILPFSQEKPIDTEYSQDVFYPCEVDGAFSKYSAPKFLEKDNKFRENICSFEKIQTDLNSLFYNTEELREFDKLESIQANTLKVFEPDASDGKELAGDYDYKIIGQLFDTYILLEYDENLYIIDQHAAQERILFDSYMNRIKQKPLDAQVFLTPYFYDAGIYYDYILKKKDILLDMGFEIQPHKNNIIKINTVPLQFGDMNLDLFFNDIAENFRENVEDSESLKEIIAKKACKNAIKGGTALQKSDIEYVLGSFFRNMPLKCPHGRPVICKISKREIEKMFRRIL